MSRSIRRSSRCRNTKSSSSSSSSSSNNSCLCWRRYGNSSTGNSIGNGGGNISRAGSSGGSDDGVFSDVDCDGITPKRSQEIKNENTIDVKVSRNYLFKSKFKNSIFM